METTSHIHLYLLNFLPKLAEDCFMIIVAYSFTSPGGRGSQILRVKCWYSHVSNRNGSWAKTRGKICTINTPCPSDAVAPASVEKYWCLGLKTCNEGLGDTEKYTRWKFYFHVYPRQKKMFEGKPALGFFPFLTCRQRILAGKNATEAPW